MKLPGPDHPITVEASPHRVRVRFNGRTVADSKHALVLRESSYRPVFYIPRADADMAMLESTSHASHCPYKGDASYFSIHAGDRVATNAVWSYAEPFPAVAQISGYLAFYPDRVDAIEEVGEGTP